MTELFALLTEALHPAAASLDPDDTLGVVRAMHACDREVLPAVEAVLPEVATAAELVAETLRAGHHLLYVGAGTSGRLGALDAAECPPTFGLPEGLVRFAIAGGPEALLRSVEQAEDDAAAGAAAVDTSSAPGDVVLGIAASSRTPYVAGALQRARATGRRTIFLTCNPTGGDELADLLIRPLVGPELVAGSTRLKAGTATKLVLNMISTAAMVRLGKVYRGRMVDLVPRCGKLVARALRIVAELGGCDEAAARSLLDACGWRARTAIVMARLGLDAAAADALIERHQGRLDRVLDR